MLDLDFATIRIMKTLSLLALAVGLVFAQDAPVISADHLKALQTAAAHQNAFAKRYNEKYKDQIAAIKKAQDALKALQDALAADAKKELGPENDKVTAEVKAAVDPATKDCTAKPGFTLGAVNTADEKTPVVFYCGAAAKP
jgi:Skp family chaperone for outer membrane proteins